MRDRGYLKNLNLDLGGKVTEFKGSGYLSDKSWKIMEGFTLPCGEEQDHSDEYDGKRRHLVYYVVLWGWSCEGRRLLNLRKRNWR